MVTGDYLFFHAGSQHQGAEGQAELLIRQVRGGETFLVTDRNHVVARLGPVEKPVGAAESELAARLAAIGARPPLRGRRPSDYSRPGRPVDLTTERIDSLLDWARGGSEAEGGK